MDTTVKKEESVKVPFLQRPVVRTILPIAGFLIICSVFNYLTGGSILIFDKPGRLFQPKSLGLLLSQSYMLLIASIGVFFGSSLKTVGSGV